MTSMAGRTYASSNFVFDLDGTEVGFINSVAGASPSAELYEHMPGGTLWKQKNVGPMQYDNFKFSAGAGMSRGFYQWIEESMKMNALYKDCACKFGDFNFKEQRLLTMMNTLVTKCEIPSLKADSKNNLYLNIELAVEMARHTKGGGNDIRGTLSPIVKQWHEANFRVTIPGLKCERMYSVEGMKFEVKVIKDPVGFGREYSIHPANFNCGDVKFTFSKADAQEAEDYANDWFRLGNNTVSAEKDIIVEFMAANMNDVLGRVELLGCGPKKADFHPENKAHGEGVARSTIEFYVTETHLSIDVAGA